MKKISINFDYQIPKKSDFVNMDKKQVREMLDKEKRRYQDYIDEVENLISKEVSKLTKGTNIIENDLLLNDNNIVDYGDSVFSYIGLENQKALEKINNLIIDIKDGIDVYHLIKNNSLYKSLNKDVILLKGVFPDIEELNKTISDMGFHLDIDEKEIINDRNCYDEPLYLILKAIESQKSLRLVED